MPNIQGANAFDNPSRCQELGPSSCRWQGNLDVTGTITSSGGGEQLANNTWLTWLNAAGTTALNILKADASNNTVLNALTGKKTSFTVNEVEIGKVDASGNTSSHYLLTDGSEQNYNIPIYGAGTAYVLTTTPAALDFGTTDPAITVNKAGTYLLTGRVNLKYNGATFAATRAVTLKFRRTNNTAADLTNGTTTLATAIVTTVTATFVVAQMPPVIYTTTNVDDAITIFGDVAVGPTAGSLDAIEAAIVAVRLF